MRFNESSLLPRFRLYSNSVHVLLSVRGLIFGTVSTLYSKWELGKSRRISIVRGRSPLKPPHVSAALGTFPIPKNINQRISASSDQTFPGRTELGHDLHTWLLSDASIIPNQSREIWHSIHLLSDPVSFQGSGIAHSSQLCCHVLQLLNDSFMPTPNLTRPLDILTSRDSGEESATQPTEPSTAQKRKRSDHEPEKGPTATRRKTACQSCRNRKVKCDNGRPACGFCVSGGVECVYIENAEDKLVYGLRPVSMHLVCGLTCIDLTRLQS
jgi:hypothetical protein